MSEFIEKLRSLHQQNEKVAPAAFFALGVLYDVLTLGRIDSTLTLINQGVFLLVASWLVYLEVLEESGVEPSGIQLSVRPYRETAVHFILGSLLSAFAVFYFKSASLFSSFVFMAMLCGLLVGNEFSQVKRLGVPLRVSMLSLCAISYWLYLIPILLGYIGTVPFLLAVVGSVALFGMFFLVLRGRVSSSQFLTGKFVLPAYSIHMVIVILYLMHWIPPVPVSVTYMGVFHKIERSESGYQLTYTRPKWKFWQNGDQSFGSREGDQLYGFASIFSPAGFKEQVKVRWLRHEGRHGWQTQDLIPLNVVGGREQGYRGYTVKQNFEPGDWRFQVETSDGREIGRLYFEVFQEDSSASREPKILTK